MLRPRSMPEQHTHTLYIVIAWWELNAPRTGGNFTFPSLCLYGIKLDWTTILLCYCYKVVSLCKREYSLWRFITIIFGDTTLFWSNLLIKDSLSLWNTTFGNKIYLYLSKLILISQDSIFSISLGVVMFSTNVECK